MTALRPHALGPLVGAITAAATLAWDAPAAAHPPDLTETEAEKAVGDTARELSSGSQEGLLAVTLDRGRTLYTHGPDTVASLDGAGTSLGPGDPERPPVCATDFYQHVLYARPSTAPDRLATVTPQIQSILRRMNALLNDEALESGSRHADYKVRCGWRAGQGRPAGAPAGRAGAAPRPVLRGRGQRRRRRRLPQRQRRLHDLRGRRLAPERRLRVGSYYTDESLSASNANNNPSGAGAGYAVVYSAPRAGSSHSCWHDETPMHENGHNQGAVQYSAPDSTGTGGHCNDLIDVMCYAPDGGNLRQSEVTNCAGAVHFDCGHDTYFDAAPESGEYLGSHWNLGSPLNRFIAFTDSASLTLSALATPSSDPSPTFSGQATGSSDVTVRVRQDTTVVRTLTATPSGGA